MATFKYLWVNRKKNSFLSKAFVVAWGKRLITLNDLIKRNWRRMKLKRRGAIVAETCEFSRLVIQGKAEFLEVGDFSFLGQVYLALHENLKVGCNVVLNDGVSIFTASHDTTCPSWSQVTAPVVINDYAWIASGAIILPGVTIGKGAVVGAGAVVSKSVPDYSIVVGNPATIVKNRNRTNNLSYNPCNLLACNSAWLKG